ncbi:hypothetical protein NSND_50495 [Nitrospira sp. ND1]|jgi:hypothetical protein|nr:hypothetical protein NSND_50495 [Nitrospira sp. ND1]
MLGADGVERMVKSGEHITDGKEKRSLAPHAGCKLFTESICSSLVYEG